MTPPVVDMEYFKNVSRVAARMLPCISPTRICSSRHAPASEFLLCNARIHHHPRERARPQVMLKLFETGEAESLLPVVATVLQFSPAELQRCRDGLRQRAEHLAAANAARECVGCVPVALGRLGWRSVPQAPDCAPCVPVCVLQTARRWRATWRATSAAGWAAGRAAAAAAAGGGGSSFFSV